MALGTGSRTRGGIYREKVVEIGDWDMDTDVLLSVAHGLPDFTKIRGIQVMIRNDAGDEQQEIAQLNGGFATPPGSASCDATDIILNREAANFFDTPDYSATGYNRGWIKIEYSR